MTPLSRVAKALYDADQPAWDWGDAAMDPLRRMYHDRAHAVIAAIREPDEQMAEAGAEIVRHVGHSQSDDAFLNDAVNIWRLMIDVVLSQRA